MNLKICKALLEQMDHGLNPTTSHVFVQQICNFLEAEFGRLDFMGDRVIGGRRQLPQDFDPKPCWESALKYVQRLVEIDRLNDEMEVIRDRLEQLKSGG